MEVIKLRTVRYRTRYLYSTVWEYRSWVYSTAAIFAEGPSWTSNGSWLLRTVSKESADGRGSCHFTGSTSWREPTIFSGRASWCRSERRSCIPVISSEKIISLRTMKIVRVLFSCRNETSIVNDIAVLQLKHALKLSDVVQPVALPNKDSDYLGDVVASGWGRTGGYLVATMPQYLQAVGLTLVTNSGEFFAASSAFYSTLRYRRVPTCHQQTFLLLEHLLGHGGTETRLDRERLHRTDDRGGFDMFWRFRRSVGG